MNAKTFISNAEGVVEPIEITELETSSGRTVRIMFNADQMDDVRLHLGKEGRVWISFYKKGGREIVDAIGSHLDPLVAEWGKGKEVSNGGTAEEV